MNLKKYFASTTMTNFFSYMTIVADKKQIDLTDFDLILAFVRNNFKNKLQKEEMFQERNVFVLTPKGNLMIMGDSAGGGMSLALTQKMIQEKRKKYHSKRNTRSST